MSSRMHQADAGEDRPSTVRLGAFGTLDPAELQHLVQSVGPEKSLERGDALWRQGERLPGVYLLLDGWAASRIAFGDGEGRMVKVHLPGDMLGLPSLSLAAAAETLVALAPATLRPLPLHSLGHMFEAHPRLAAMLFLVSQEERVALMDRLVAVTRTSAVAQVAAVIVQLHARIVRGAPDTGDSFHLPLARQDLADLAGVTTAQLARALKQLRDTNVLGWSHQRVTIVDAEALRVHAQLPDRRLAHDPLWLPAGEQR